MIPSDRTAVPVEWDEVKTQLMRLATELGPKEGAQGGVSDTSVSRFIDSAANALDGNGDKLRQTLAQLSGVARIFAEGSGNIVDIIKNLQIFVTALRDSKEQIVLFENRLATSDQRPERQQVRSGRGAVRSVRRDRRGAALRRGQPRTRPPSRSSGLAQRHPDPRRQQDGPRERAAHHAERDRQLREHLLPERRVGDRSVLARQLLAIRCRLICGMIGAVENTTAPETAKLCAQYLGPALRLLNFNNLPFPINPYLRPAINPDRIIYTDPKLAPGGAGPGDAPEPPPTVSAYTGAGDIPPPPGWNGPPNTWQGLYAPPPATTHPSTPSPAVINHAPPIPVRRTSSPTSRRDRRPSTGHAAPADRGAAAADPNAPLLPAEGTPPS